MVNDHHLGRLDNKKNDNFLIIYLFLERGEGREKEREISMCGCLLCPLLGAGPATQAYSLSGNQTNNPLLRNLELNPLSQARAKSQSDKIFKRRMIKSSLVRQSEFAIPKDGPSGNVSWTIRYLNCGSQL